MVTLEIAKERLFKTHEDKIEVLEYRNVSSHARFKCNICNNIWEANANSVCRGNGCPECKRAKAGRSQRFSYADVKKHIEENGCHLVSNEYANSKINLEIRFECGHIGNMSFECFQRGQRCVCNARERQYETIEKKTRENFLKEIGMRGFKFVSFENDWASWDSKVTIECNKGHVETRKIRSLMRRKNCGTCTKIKISLETRGKGGSNWQGGITELRPFLQKQIVDWKKSSTKNCNYKCVISGNRFDVVHHLHSFNAIIKEAINNLGFETYETIGEYNEEDLFDLADEVVVLHEFYGNGVCLRKDIHLEFHRIYLCGNNTPEQFEDFKQKIAAGEIKTKQ